MPVQIRPADCDPAGCLKHSVGFLCHSWGTFYIFLGYLKPNKESKFKLFKYYPNHELGLRCLRRPSCSGARLRPDTCTLAQWYPLPFLFGSGFPYKVANPKKGALIVIWLLAVTGLPRHWPVHDYWFHVPRSGRNPSGRSLWAEVALSGNLQSESSREFRVSFFSASHGDGAEPPVARGSIRYGRASASEKDG